MTFKPKDYFGEFSWPVLEAFSDALEQCRFEEGDILYDCKAAYDLPWGEALEELYYSIQVTFPPQAITPTGERKSDDSDVPIKGKKKRISVIERNWATTLKLKLTNYKDDRKVRHIDTYQGNLYYALWKGDLSFLEEKTPDIPLVQRVINLLSSEMLESLSIGFKRERAFVFAVDRTSNLFNSKVEKMREIFRGEHDYESIPISSLPEFAGEVVLPTIDLVIFHLDLDPKDIESRMKEAFYTPSKDRKTNKDMFRLRAHGLLKQRGFRLE